MEGITALYHEQHARLLAMCTAILHDRADAEDAVQETFARAAARLDTLGGDPVGYLVVVARNVCRDELRRRDRASKPFAARFGPDTDVESTAVDRTLLRRAWDELPAPERSLLAAVASGLTTGEIARRVGLSVNAVAQRISRARRHARSVITAPAALVLPVLRDDLLPRLRRAGQAAGDAAAALFGWSQGIERTVAPLLLAVIAGALGSGVTSQASPVAPHHGASPLVAPVPVQRAGAVDAVHAMLAQARRAVPAGGASAPAVPGAPLPQQVALQGNRVVAVTESPDYAHDHTVFATTMPADAATPGTRSCSAATCGGLFRSDDGARTWHSFGGAGLMQGTILLPPQFPRDPTLYAVAAGTALLRSQDGGAHFQPVLPLAPQAAAIEPDSPSGAARVWLLTSTLAAPLVWDAADGSLRPVTALPPDLDSVTSVFTAPGSAEVFVNLVEVVGGASLWACENATTCHRAGPATVTVPVVAAGGKEGLTFFLIHHDGLDVRSPSGAVTWKIDSGPVDAVLPDADFARTGQFDVVATASTDGRAQLLSVRRFLAGGMPAALSRPWAPPPATKVLQRLPDGRILAVLGPAVGAAHTDGVMCSADDGATWAAAC